MISDSTSCYLLLAPQYATLGKYGTFELQISADDGTMTWKSDLHKIDALATELGIVAGIPSMNYHLHQSWTLSADYAIGGVDCGLANLGNHYDPYFAVSSMVVRCRKCSTVLCQPFNLANIFISLRLCCVFLNIQVWSRVWKLGCDLQCAGSGAKCYSLCLFGIVRIRRLQRVRNRRFVRKGGRSHGWS